jgi:hypothetical protein
LWEFELRSIDRQGEHKISSDINGAIHIDVASVTFQDSLDDGQPMPASYLLKELNGDAPITMPP